MPYSIYGRSPEEFKMICEKLDSLSTKGEQLEHMYKLTGQVYHDEPKFVTSGDKPYKLGIHFDSDIDYEQRDNWYFNRGRLIYAETWKQDLDSRLNEMPTVEAQKLLLQHEIEGIKEKIKPTWTTAGYTSALSGKKVNKNDLIVPPSGTEMDNKYQASTEAIRVCSTGMALYDFDIYINEKLRVIESGGSIAPTISRFKPSEKNGVRINLIRILKAMHRLKMFQKTDGSGQCPTLKEFMEETGIFFGTGLTNYDGDLSQALKKGTSDSNGQIFDDMKKIIIDEFSKRQEQPDKPQKK